jgi:hypothetical protein
MALPQDALSTLFRSSFSFFSPLLSFPFSFFHGMTQEEERGAVIGLGGLPRSRRKTDKNPGDEAHFRRA